MTIAFNSINGNNKIPAAIHKSDSTASAQLLEKLKKQEGLKVILMINHQGQGRGLF